MPVNVRPGSADKACELCGRVRPLSFHHLIPRSLHSNKWFRKNFDRNDMATRGADLCAECHNFIHVTYQEKELGRRLNTLKALRSDRQIKRFVTWVSRQT